MGCKFDCNKKFYYFNHTFKFQPLVFNKFWENDFPLFYSYQCIGTQILPCSKKVRSQTTVTMAKFIWNTRVNSRTIFRTWYRCACIDSAKRQTVQSSTPQHGGLQWNAWVSDFDRTFERRSDFIQKHIAKFVVTACALQIYKCKLK